MIQAMCVLFSPALQQSFWKKQTLFPDVFCHIFMTDLNRTLSDKISASIRLETDGQDSEQPLPLSTSLALLWTWVDFLQRLSRTLSWEQHSTGAEWPSPADWATDGALQPPPSTFFKDQSQAGQVLVSWLRQSRWKQETSVEQAACNSNKGLIFLV